MKSVGKTKEMEVHEQLLILSLSLSQGSRRAQSSPDLFLYPSNAIYWRTSGRDWGWRLETGEQRMTAETLEWIQASWQPALRHRFLLLCRGQCPPGQVSAAEKACQIRNVSFMDMSEGFHFAKTESYEAWGETQVRVFRSEDMSGKRSHYPLASRGLTTISWTVKIPQETSQQSCWCETTWPDPDESTLSGQRERKKTNNKRCREKNKG